MKDEATRLSLPVVTRTWDFGFVASTEKKKSKRRYSTFEKSSNPSEMIAALKHHTGGSACLIISHIDSANYPP